MKIAIKRSNLFIFIEAQLEKKRVFVRHIFRICNAISVESTQVTCSQRTDI